MRSLALIILLCCSAIGMAQETVLKISAVSLDDDTGKKLQGTTMEIYQDGESFAKVKTDSSGKYEPVDLPINHDYVLKLRKEGYVTKMATIDAHVDYPEDYDAEIPFAMQISLFKVVDSLDFSFLDTTSLINFHVDQQGFQAWDHAYTKTMLKKIELVKKGYKIEDINQYYGFLDEGERFFYAGELDSSILNYRKASGILPSMNYPKERLSELDNIKSILLYDYATCMQYGNKLMQLNNYEEAIVYFRIANRLEPEVTDAKAKIEECNNNLLLGDGTEAEIYKQYNKIINVADSNFDNFEYEKALELFERCARLNPTNAYPILMIQMSKQKLNKK